MQPTPMNTTSGPSIPGTTEDAAARIYAFTDEIVREALTVRALVDTLKGAKKFIEQAAREYAERFLFELIQNAYDAQPPASRGRVLVVFDATEGEFGCVYVANTGRPFTDANFRAVCEIAQSSKRPGEGIGNKGVGFKSVLQVAAWPEIYSRGGHGVGFDGYCFRFADPAAMRTLTKSDEEASNLGDRISSYGLPIYIAPASHPARLSEFADAGYVSVIRLPLRTARAGDITRKQISDAVSRHAPLLLFLDRLAELRIEVIEPLEGLSFMSWFARSFHQAWKYLAFVRARCAWATRADVCCWRGPCPTSLSSKRSRRRSLRPWSTSPGANGMETRRWRSLCESMNWMRRTRACIASCRWTIEYVARSQGTSTLRSR